VAPAADAVALRLHGPEQINRQGAKDAKQKRHEGRKVTKQKVESLRDDEACAG